MKIQWKAVAKTGAITIGEVAVLTGSIVLTKKFVDFNTLFKKQIDADPKYAEKFHIKHQGLIKIGAGVIGATLIKNPWLKMVFIGIAIEGAITEARVLMTDSAGISFFDKIGADDIDKEMIEAAKLVRGNDDDEGENKRIEGYGDRFESAVSGYGDKYESGVSGGKNDIDLNSMQASYVSGFR